MFRGAWGWLKVAALGAVFGAFTAIGRRFKWPIAFVVLVIAAILYPHVSGPILLAVAVLTSTHSWVLAVGTLLLMWALWRLIGDAVAVSRGAAETAHDILIGLRRLHKLRRAYPDMAAKTGCLTARGSGAEIAPAGRWRPMPRGSVQTFVAYGSVGREWSDLVTACKRMPQQVNAARARPIQIPGVTIGADVLFEWGAHLSRIWTAGDVYALAHTLGCPPGHIPLGVTEDGLLGTVNATHSILFGGSTESGKSSAIWMGLLGHLMQGHRIRLWVVDPKGGVELGYLGKHVGVRGGLLEVRRYESDDAVLRQDAAYAAGGFWDELRRVMDSKEAELKRRGKREMSLEDGDVLDILIVDEWLGIANDPNLRQQRMDHIANRITYRGRATLCKTWICTQSGNKDVVGPIRDLIAVKVAFRTPNSSNTDVILGEGATRDGADAHDLDLAHDKGVCVMAAEGQAGFLRMRVGYVADLEAKAIAAGTVPEFQAATVDLTRPCALYRATLAIPVTVDGVTYPAGTLAYFGIAYDPPARFRQHAADPDQWWWQHCRVEIDRWYETPALGMSPRQQALLAEEDAVKRFRPLFNDQHNRDNPTRILRGTRGAP